MNQYRRIVSYLYQYVNGVKGQNIGYVRMEQKGRQCRITVQMRAVKVDFMPEVWLFKQEPACIEYVSAGRLSIYSGSMQSKVITNVDDVCLSGHPADDFDGAIIYINEKEYYATTWTNESIYIGEKVNMLENRLFFDKSGENEESVPDSEVNRGEVNEKTDVIHVASNEEDDDSGVDIIKKQDSKAGTDEIIRDKDNRKQSADIKKCNDNEGNVTQKSIGEKVSVQQDKYVSELEASSINGCSSCPFKNYSRKSEDFGTRMLKNFPVMYPFKSGIIEESVRIEPKDIGCMPIRLWSFANNRFLLHGYYCYKHLIFVRLHNGSYALGVPGVYSEAECKKAADFSFEEFQAIGPGKTEHGIFGYWLAKIKD